MRFFFLRPSLEFLRNHRSPKFLTYSFAYSSTYLTFTFIHSIITQLRYNNIITKTNYKNKGKVIQTHIPSSIQLNKQPYSLPDPQRKQIYKNNPQ